jgi:hypothetical protein
MRPLFDRIRIVAYVRDPVTWANSRAQQYIKKQVVGLAELTDPRAVDRGDSAIVPAYRHLERYVQVFGLENMIVRRFDRRDFPDGDLLQDFCAVIGRPRVAEGLLSRRSNPSLSAEAVLLMDAYNQVLRDRNESGRKPTLMRRHLEMLPGSPFSLPRATLEAVLHATAADRAWLEETFGLTFSLPPLPDENERPAWGPEVLRALVSQMEEGPPGRVGRKAAARDGRDWRRLLFPKLTQSNPV